MSKNMRKFVFIFGNVLILGVVPSAMVWVVGNTTVALQAIELANQLGIEKTTQNIQIIMNHATQSNMFYWKWRTLVMCAYIVFLSVWVLLSVGNFISFLEDLE